MPGLKIFSASLLKGPPIWLGLNKAEKLLDQFQETASFRHWELHALAIMANHFHIVVTVPNDPSPRKVLIDFKAYGSRCLNRAFGVPPSETWWTTNGSKRKLRDEFALEAAINYVLYKQSKPLVLWSACDGRLARPGEP